VFSILKKIVITVYYYLKRILYCVRCFINVVLAHTLIDINITLARKNGVKNTTKIYNVEIQDENKVDS